MRHFRLSRWLLTILFVTGLIVPAAAATDIGLTHGTNKHRPEFSFSPAESYTLRAARNEWEPFQVLVRDDDGLTNVDVAVSEFVGPGDAVIDEVELYRVHYLPVAVDEISHQPPDPSRAGDWPDGLVPFVDHFFGEERAGAPFDVPADYTQGVFVDVFVPTDAAPGTYTATVTVTADGMDTWIGEVQLIVWDFALPTGMSLRSNYQYKQEDICEYHEMHGNLEDCDALHDRYMIEFARHRMSPYNRGATRPVPTWNPETQVLTLDWTAWDAERESYLDGTFYKPGFEMQSVMIPPSFGGVPEDLTQEEWNTLHWQGYANHLREKGWFDKAWSYLTDEPAPDEYADIALKAAQMHAADADIQTFVTEQYNDVLLDAIDIWCPDEPMFSDSLPWPPFPERYEQLRDLGKTTWWYNCVSATLGFDYANHMIDQESTYMRIWLWLTRRYGFTGILFWRINYLWGRQDVWEDMYTDRYMCQGDGTMYYPGTPDKVGGEHDIPIPSIRIKVLREAMEDYEYFVLLDNMGYADWVDAVTRTVAPKTYQWEHDWAVLLDWRRKVGEKIAGTLDETPPAPPTNLQAVGGTYAATLTWSAPADEDLAGYDVWYAMFPGDKFFAGTLAVGTQTAFVEGLTPGVEHTFWINAFDTNGNRSVDSETVTATPAGEGDDDAVDDDDDSSNRNGVSVRGAGSEDAQGEQATEDEPDDTFACGGW